MADLAGWRRNGSIDRQDSHYTILFVCSGCGGGGGSGSGAALVE